MQAYYMTENAKKVSEVCRLTIDLFYKFLRIVFKTACADHSRLAAC